MKKQQSVVLVFAFDSFAEYMVRLAGAILGNGTCEMINEKALHIRQKSRRAELR
jgi:hypothetical protein